jgi:hypothetical protein
MLHAVTYGPSLRGEAVPVCVGTSCVCRLTVLHIRIKHMFHIPRRTFLLHGMPLQAHTGDYHLWAFVNSTGILIRINLRLCLLELSSLSLCCNALILASFAVKTAWLYFKYLEENK